MAYSVSASLAVSTATPKINQKVLATLTVDNSGGSVDVTIDGVEVTPEANSPLVIGQTSPDGLPQAGTNEASGYGQKTVTAGTSGTFLFYVLAPAAGAFKFNATAIGTRADTGARIQIPTSSAVTVTAS